MSKTVERGTSPGMTLIGVHASHEQVHPGRLLKPQPAFTDTHGERVLPQLQATQELVSR